MNLIIFIMKNNTVINKAVIYKITSPVDDKCYIGMTVANLQARFSAHKSKARADWQARDNLFYSHWRSIWKHNCSCEIVEQIYSEGITYGECKYIESSYISKLGTLNTQFSHHLNLTH